ncbi:hypothetical protein J2848_002022 [Azospirillum lipoferum]|nr:MULTISPECIES: hypothetical protein [Azospirillum]MCP1610363.1 hypothetical protein [Azospirillum lipoferum]MDW5534144.1 hypothetical protein [Azospirillum sp. NL1]
MAVTEGVKPIDRTMLDRSDPVNRHKTAGMSPLETPGLPMGTLSIGVHGLSPVTPRLVGRSLTLNPVQALVKNEPSGNFHRKAKKLLRVLGEGAYNPLHRRRGAERQCGAGGETEEKTAA